MIRPGKKEYTERKMARRIETDNKQKVQSSPWILRRPLCHQRQAEASAVTAQSHVVCGLTVADVVGCYQGKFVCKQHR